jgi:hypothetical protein
MNNVPLATSVRGGKYWGSYSALEKGPSGLVDALFVIRRQSPRDTMQASLGNHLHRESRSEAPQPRAAEPCVSERNAAEEMSILRFGFHAGEQKGGIVLGSCLRTGSKRIGRGIPSEIESAVCGKHSPDQSIYFARHGTQDGDRLRQIDGAHGG